jgi:hypothetical protein
MDIMNVEFKPLGVTQQDLDYLLKLGLKYDKRQKKQMLAAATVTLPSEDEVRDFEKKNGFMLPSDYRAFLLNINGGVPSKSLVDVPKIGEQVVQRCYALKSPAVNYTLGRVLENYEGRVPQVMLPIGDDPGGNLFLIGVSGEECYGKVYFWDHEQEADLEPQPYFENIYYVAGSFNEFLLSLK